MKCQRGKTGEPREAAITKGPAHLGNDGRTEDRPQSVIIEILPGGHVRARLEARIAGGS